MDEQIIIFSTPNCKYCGLAKEWFEERSYPYSEYDVSKDKEALDRMVELSGKRAVPVIAIGSTIVNGFDPEQFERAIEFEGLEESEDRYISDVDGEYDEERQEQNTNPYDEEIDNG